MFRYKVTQSDLPRPSCSQCQATSLLCRYQEGGKRGLPAAYMTSLEDRLQETEKALYATLRALQAHSGGLSVPELLDGHIPTVPMPQRSKAEKQSEWKRQPLRTTDDFVAWTDEQHLRFGAPSNAKYDAARLEKHVDERYHAETPATLSTIAFHDEHLPARTHPLSTPSEAVIEQLRLCRPPTVPNDPMVTTYSGAWYDTYF